VTPAADIVAGKTGASATDSSGAGIITFGNNVTVGNRFMISEADWTQANAFATGANNKLVREGSDITVLFGVSKGIDYQAVINTYSNPAANFARNYMPLLQSYLQTLGLPPLSAADAWARFQTLSPALQHIFADKVFFAELRYTGTTADYAVGYNA